MAGINLSPDAFRRVSGAVKRLENTPRNDSPADLSGPVVGTSHTMWVRVTSATQTAGKNPGRIQTACNVNTNPVTWTEGGSDDCWVTTHDGTALATGRYFCRLMGIFSSDGKALFMPDSPSSGGGASGIEAHGWILSGGSTTDPGQVIQMGHDTDYTEQRDTDGYYASDVAVVIPSGLGGMYHLNAWIRVDDPLFAYNLDVIGYIRLNDASNLVVQSIKALTDVTVNGVVGYICLAVDWPLEVDDSLTVQIDVATGGNFTVSGAFCGHYLGDA